MEVTNFGFTFGASPRLRFTLKVPDPAGCASWTTEFRLFHSGNTTPVFTKAGDLTDAAFVANADVIGSFDVALPVSEYSPILKPITYRWSFWRTNTGFEDPLAKGELELSLDAASD